MKLILFDVVPYHISYPRPTCQNTEEEKEKELCEEEVQEEQEGRNPEEADPEEDPTKGKKSALSIGKYKVKSTVEPDGSRTWYCPFENCSKVFRLSGKCHGHLNEHMGRIYECPKCKYSGYSMDAYKKHVCFKGWKTQGEVKRKRWGSVKAEKAKKCKVTSAEGKAPGTDKAGEMKAEVDEGRRPLQPSASAENVEAEVKEKKVQVKEKEQKIKKVEVKEKEKKVKKVEVKEKEKKVTKEEKVAEEELKVQVQEDGIELIVLD